MSPPSVRLACRARNPFSPGTALWQHFVVPNQHLLRQARCSSSVPAATQDTATRDAQNYASLEPTVSEQPRIKPQRNKNTNISIRRVTTSKGTFHRSKRTVSIERNIWGKAQTSKESLAATEKLLHDTRVSYEAGHDYKGVIVRPIESEITVKSKYFPWCIPVEERPSDPMDRLNREIELFHEYMRPDAFESIARKHLIEQVRTLVRKKHPRRLLEVFGSEKTGLAFATSDIDLRMVDQSDLPSHDERKSSATSALVDIHYHILKKHPEYTKSSLRYARFPLVAIRDRKSGLDVQIVLTTDKSKSRAWVAKYLAEYPYLRQVYSVVKTMFDVRGLSDVFTGGFGSYSLFMMLVASIKHSPNARNDAAGALVNFLRFWQSFNTMAHGISIEPVELYEKAAPEGTTSGKAKPRIKPLPPFMLSLRDPADETNDLGRKGIAIKHVQATIADICGKLSGALRHNTLHTTLTPLVDPVFMLNKQSRYQLHKYGKSLSNDLHLSLASTAKAIRDAEAASAATPRAENMWEGLPGMEGDSEVV